MKKYRMARALFVLSIVVIDWLAYQGLTTETIKENPLMTVLSFMVWVGLILGVIYYDEKKWEGK